MSFLIREAKIEDACGAATVKVLTWQAAYRGIIPDDYLSAMDIDKYTERHKEFLGIADAGHQFVAEYDGQIIGILSLTKCRDDDKSDSGAIEAIYLLQEHWDKGYGKKLMDFAIDKLREHGYSEICIWTLDENTRARKFYEKCGFSFDGAKMELVIGKPLILVRYVLTLPI